MELTRFLVCSEDGSSSLFESESTNIRVDIWVEVSLSDEGRQSSDELPPLSIRVPCALEPDVRRLEAWLVRRGAFVVRKDVGFRISGT